MMLKPAAFTASLVVLCAMAVPQVASATVAGASGAAAACKAASGPGAAVFYFDSMGALNTSNVTQYLTCNIPDVDGGASNGGGSDIQELDLRWSNTTSASITITCVFQAINTGTATNAVYTLGALANTPDNHRFIYTSSDIPALPARVDQGFYTMSCAIPAGVALNMIKAYYPGNIGP